MTEHIEFEGIPYYSRIYDLAFYVKSSEEILDESCINVTNKEIMRNDRPAPEGLYDPHMGTTSFTWDCSTCGNQKAICPGHPGSLDLKYPVKSPMFRDELLKWLKIICYHCGNVVVKIKSGGQPDKLLSELVKNVKTVNNCPHCGEPHLQVMKDKKKPFIFWRIKQSDNKKIVTKEEYYNHHIKKVLERITTKTVEQLGKPSRSHPKKFILTSIPVPPNTIRPDIRRIGGSRSSNSDTTSLLKTIFEINEVLPEEIPEDSQLMQKTKDAYYNLDVAYHSMVKGGSNGDVKMVTNTNKQPVAIAERFPKKSGRIRRNLMGKRVEYMIRSVITGDPDIQIDEVGVPKIHAMDLEIPEKVTARNIEKLKRYFNNGTKAYPGCKHIIRGSDGGTYRRDLLDPNYQLQIGDTVMRDMITGDYLCFNRQPSLLFSNISGMRVVVMESGNTLRINPAVCNFFNADFDGDQMNSIVPQNIMSRNECMIVSKVARWLISPQNHAPLVGAFQDALIGLFELTKNGLTFSKWHSMQMFNKINSKNINYDFTESHYTNRQLVSRILPEINVTGKSPSYYQKQFAPLIKYDPEDIAVNIVRGELKSGVLDKSTSGQSVAGSIVHIIANEYGSDMALRVVYNLQQIVHQFFLYHGFTVGISDINISANAMAEVKKNLATLVLNSRKITQRMNDGKLIAPLGTSFHDYYENEQINALAAGDDFVNPILSDINIKTNHLVRLILSGSKGKMTNFVSINGAIGVQTINGNRFGAQAGWGRTSPYFVRYDTEPDANGFISMSFREGVRSDVYCFMAGEARHGLISNALKTSVTGYQNRISIKNLESIIVDNMRKSTKNMNVIQPLYAECGLDAGKLEKVKFPTIAISDKMFIEKYKADSSLFPNIKINNEIFEKEFEQLNVDRDYYRKIHMTLEAHNPKEYVMSDTKQMPVNVARIIDDIVYNYKDISEKIEPEEKILDPKYAIEIVKATCESLGYVFTNDLQRRLNAPIPKYIKSSTKLLQILIRSYLCTKNLVQKSVYNSLLDIILQKIVTTYKKSLIDYGTSVGIIAAQCVCEQFTQYVLDSKHRTGGGGGTKTNAIIRTQEVLGAKLTESMKNPRMLIMVKPEYEHDKIKVQEIANHIEMMNFGRFISTTRIFFEEYGNPLHPNYKHEVAMIKEFEKYNYGIKIPGDLASWCIRYTLNREEMILKSMKLETIILALRKTHPEIFIAYSSENSKDIIIRVYLRNSMFKQSVDYYKDNVVFTMKNLSSVVVRGIRNIIGTSVIDVMRHEIITEGENKGALELKKIYAIAAAGTNMTDIMSNPYIDAYRTQSDSIEEIQRVFGLTAARNKIINEMMAALENLNRMHCSLFADEMCYAGQVSNIQKTGLQKREYANVSLRISFQTAIQVIQNAAIHGLIDKINGLSGSLIMGTNPLIGTTYNSIILDEEFIAEQVKNFENNLDDL